MQDILEQFVPGIFFSSIFYLELYLAGVMPLCPTYGFMSLVYQHSRFYLKRASKASRKLRKFACRLMPVLPSRSISLNISTIAYRQHINRLTFIVTSQSQKIRLNFSTHSSQVNKKARNFIGLILARRYA